jgi:hypothetical protein
MAAVGGSGECKDYGAANRFSKMKVLYSRLG